MIFHHVDPPLSKLALNVESLCAQSPPVDGAEYIWTIVTFGVPANARTGTRSVGLRTAFSWRQVGQDHCGSKYEVDYQDQSRLLTIVNSVDEEQIGEAMLAIGRSI